MKIGLGHGVLMDTNLSTVKDSAWYSRLLIQDGHDVTIITNNVSDEGLNKIVKMLFVRHKYIVNINCGAPKKVCRGFDIYVDSDLKQIRPLFGEVKHLFLFTTPQNTDEQVPEGIVRVANWWALYQEIRYEI